ncbi:MAG: acyl-CoA dehydrogenase family protein [Proteobacteria bacterium]|nr:acyl-CoA dehydrogenase family protein [Pseudomonadota bacterium]
MLHQTAPDVSVRAPHVLCEAPVETRDLQSFIEQVRAFLSENLTEDLREAGRRTTGVHSEIEASRTWHTRLYRRGWIAPSWPVEFGGTGWTSEQRFVFDQECARADAPILFAGGLRSLGPLIIALGTAQQKRRYLPPILSGDDLWCQGFSESGAGSDLAAIATRAVVKGDSYVVSGRKLWTTGAHLSNRMFALVRTMQADKPQEGITFLLIDMATPGLCVKPIVTMDGQHEFNEVVFDDVVVPQANRIGAENDGWSVAKHLMRFARTNNTTCGLLRRVWRSIERALETSGLLEPSLRTRLTALACKLATFEAQEMRLLSSGRLSGDDEAGSSLMKLSATELHQQMSEVFLELSGPLGIVAPGLAFGDHRLRDASHAVEKYLATRAASIYSGTNEIHRNVLSKALMAGKVGW